MIGKTKDTYGLTSIEVYKLVLDGKLKRFPFVILKTG